MSEFQIGITIVTLGFLSLLAYAAWQGRGLENPGRDVQSGQAGIAQTKQQSTKTLSGER